jgi:hypothetical protein
VPTIVNVKFQKKQMPANINIHIARLHRFLPFSSAHDQIYEEYQTGEDNLDLNTIAIDYAIDAIRNGAKCVILTGDAGHGKTHMCRRLLEKGLLGYDSEQARKLLQTNCDAQAAIPPADGKQATSLRIHKDLSEVQPPSQAAKLFEDAINKPGECLIVCANEGRLRAIINSIGAGKACHSVNNVIQESFQSGVTADERGEIHIINLNYQSVASKGAGQQPSLLRRVLSSWVGDRRRYRSCSTCAHQDICPIRRNHELLAEQGEETEIRIQRLEEIFEVMERLGVVVTIREMLMLVSYLITGGLNCTDVDNKAGASHGKKGWQHQWAFYNLLFSPPPNLPVERAIKGIPILAALMKLDPGGIAVRTVDEKILNWGNIFIPNQLDLQFMTGQGARITVVDAAYGIDDFIGNPQNRAELLAEAIVVNTAVASLRRRSFFDNTGKAGSVMLNLGFKFGDMFVRLLQGDLQAHESVSIKNKIIAGLDSIQGLRVGKSETILYLVDPAFGKASADAAIISRQIPSSLVQLISATHAWEAVSGTPWFLPRSVDWIDRSVVLRIAERNKPPKDLQLDLLSFECIARAASGYVSENFYANEIRRIRTFLGQLAEEGSEDIAQISVFMRGQLHNVSLDQGVIQVGG